jgi:predicted acyl esterase
MNPKGLETIVPSAGLASMYDHQYQAGVPWLLQWLGPVYGYEGLALARHLPPGTPQAIVDAAGWGTGGGYFGQNPHEAACGATQNAAVSGESMASGQYTAYHKERDFSEGAKNWNGKIWLVHGVNDEAARIASIYWFNQRGVKPGDKLWIGQWNHGIGCCPNRRGLQWTAALHAWFDKTLLGRDVDTGPAIELFLNDAPTDVEAIESQGEVRTSKSWPLENTRQLTFWTRTDKTLGDDPGEDGANTYRADAEAFNGGREAAGAVDYATEPLKEDLLIAGPPTLELALSQTVERLHVTPTLIDESPDGARRRISTCALQTELREGLDKITPVIPTQRMLVKPPCFTMAHHLKAGHKLVLKVASSDEDHVPTFANDPQVSVFSGKEGTRFHLPVVPASDLYPDTLDLAAEGYGGSGA